MTSSGYVSLAEESGEKTVKEELEDEESANISNIFVGESSRDMSREESISCVKECDTGPTVKMETDDSAAVLVSNLAAQILGGSCKGCRQNEPSPVNVKKEVLERGDGDFKVTDPEMERGLECSGIRQGKKDLDKPGKLGWVREVVTHRTKGHVTCAYYITPPHPVTGARKRLRRQQDIEDYLEASGNRELSFRNFNVNARFLALKPEFEVLRPSMASGLPETAQQSPLFAGYFRELPGDSTSGPLDYSSLKVIIFYLFGELM